jgi:hypothetical protein
MTTIASARRSSFGMRCVHCDNELIAPEWTEHRNERHIIRQCPVATTPEGSCGEPLA